MAVKIRLSRKGTKHKPFYRLVVMPSQNKRDGKFIEVLGFYDPKVQPPKIKVDQKRLEYWLSCGAQKTEGVRKILDPKTSPSAK
ncbi:30S ribosomal protein S16 [Candidatus Microgenomates bacterium]|nr:30S ribosomal protein S16 [Candidatus Microgenomates bacterium]